MGSLRAMVTPEHVQQVIETYCKAESAKDRDTWLSLFAPDATHEDPVGTPVNRGIEAIGAFFDAGAGPDGPRPARHRAADRRRRRGARVPRGARGHGAERLLLSPIVDHMVFDGDGRIVGLRAFFDPAASAPTRSEPGVSRRTTSTRTGTTRACCARTGGAPRRTRPATCSPRSCPACACSTSAAARARSPSTSRSGSRPAGASASTAPSEVLDGARARPRATRASTTSSSPWATCTRSTVPDDVVRRRARAPGAAAPHRSGRGAARDAAGVRAGRHRRRARQRLRGVHLVPRRTRASTGGSSCTTRSRAATTPSPTPAGTCSRGRARPGFADVVATASALVLRHAGGPGLVGRAVGGPGRRRRPSPSRRSTAGSRRAPSSSGIGRGVAAWSESPDAWFAMLHGELRATT